MKVALARARQLVLIVFIFFSSYFICASSVKKTISKRKHALTSRRERGEFEIGLGGMCVCGVDKVANSLLLSSPTARVFFLFFVWCVRARALFLGDFVVENYFLG